jgi:hypothetical protein
VAHQWIRDNPDQAYGIIGKRMRLSSKDTAYTLKVVKLLTVPENKNFFGTTAAPGDLFKISDEAAKFFKQSGPIQEVKPPSSYINLDFVSGF